MKILSSLFLVFLSFFTFAQMVDNFDDGDFTNNPTWSGTSADFSINTGNQLQTNSSIAATSYLSTSNLLTDINNKEWNFFIKQSYSGSSSNFSKVFLTADNANLNSVQNGYFLQFGEAGSNDAIRLVLVTAGIEAVILTGTSGNVANSFQVGVRILHKSTGEWMLFTDYSGGTNYVFEAQSSPDMNMIAHPYFGLYCQYTVSNTKKNYLDNVYVGNEIIDTTPPAIDSAFALDNHTLKINFNEIVDGSITTQNITTTPSLNINSINQNPDLMSITIDFSTNFINGMAYQGNIPNVADLNGNNTNLNFIFTYLVADSVVPGDVIISEFMADPSPQIGLPDAEYVEIYNKSNKYFNLSNWKIKNHSSTGTIQTKWLLPGQYIVITSTSNQTYFSNSIGATSFPSLLNTGDDIILTDKNNVLLDKLAYTLDWYNDNMKKDGGYSLERKKLNLVCSDQSNWAVSIDPMGGTPGFVNSINDTTLDVAAPWIQNVFTTSDTTITVIFNEPIDGSWNTSNFSIQPFIQIDSVRRDTNQLSTFYLLLSIPLQMSTSYVLSATNLTDCQGNMVNETYKSLIFPAKPKKGDLIFNELLFNPLSGGSDYIEIKNKTKKIFNLKGLKLSNTKTGSSNNLVIDIDYFLQPDALVVLTPDSSFQKHNYPFHGTGNFIQTSIPAMNTDASTIVLSIDSTTLDSTTYSSKWHYQLLSDLKGKALEKINKQAPSTVATSWHTASEASNFGTPGSENSQNTDFLYNGKLTLSTPTISPDNDGFEDVLVMNYEMEALGYVGNIKIYNDRGSLIRDLIQNELLGNSGQFIWDGLNDKVQKAHVGTYIILFEGYNTNSGKTFKLKKVVVVAGNK